MNTVLHVLCLSACMAALGLTSCDYEKPAPQKTPHGPTDAVPPSATSKATDATGTHPEGEAASRKDAPKSGQTK